MMVINFTEKEISAIEDIIERYRSVSDKLYMYQTEADKIQKKLMEETEHLQKIKNEEDILMEELHKKYGNFTIQDIYMILNQ